MDFELLESLGWREGLIAIIALLVLYIIVLYVRLTRLQRAAAAPPPLPAQSAVAAYAAIQETTMAPVEPASNAPATATAGESVGNGEAPREEFPWNEPPPEIPGQAVIDALRRELYQLRCELGGLRDELRAEVVALREELLQASVPSLDPPQAASPLYSDAMQLAVQGHDATTIARHCGIARAEADLVVALARRRGEGR